MSLPENLTYGGAVAAQSALTLNTSFVKANFGYYVASNNDLDAHRSLKITSSQRKDGAFDCTLRYDHYRNMILSTGATSEIQNDRLASVVLRTIAPMSSVAGDGRFTQSEIVQIIRGLGSILYTTSFLEAAAMGQL